VHLFFFSSRRRHTRFSRDWSSDVCSSDLNDLAATDMTFGFQTAVEVATDAIGRLHSTAEAHQRAMIVQVMGRHTGWIALESGLRSEERRVGKECGWGGGRA